MQNHRIPQGPKPLGEFGRSLREPLNFRGEGAPQSKLAPVGHGRPRIVGAMLSHAESLPRAKVLILLTLPS